MDNTVYIVKEGCNGEFAQHVCKTPLEVLQVIQLRELEMPNYCIVKKKSMNIYDILDEIKEAVK